MKSLNLRNLLTAVFVASTLALAGCTSEDSFSASAIQKSHQDAEKRYFNEVGGMDQTTQTINVPVGASKLTVKAHYSTGGLSSFALQNPAGQSEKEDSAVGGKNVQDDSWYVTNNPTPGNWQFSIEISGGGTYSFGFYY